jgi:hypothetical protein
MEFRFSWKDLQTKAKRGMIDPPESLFLGGGGDVFLKIGKDCFSAELTD